MVELPLPLISGGLQTIADFLTTLASSREIIGGLFRGHTEIGHRPLPKAFRDRGSHLRTAEQLELWKKFISRVSPVRPANDMEYLVLAQHYGVVTALLDWTSNPLVAMFFSCSGNQDVDGVIWGLRSFFMNEFREPIDFDLFEETRDAPILVDAGAMNPRSKIQHSMMTLHTLNETEPNMWEVFTIPAARKIGTLHALERFGINAESIFDDPALAAKSFQEGILSDPFDPFG
ncbi:MAG TPA: FRG domain-containing protein [Sphingobium sp.]